MFLREIHKTPIAQYPTRIQYYNTRKVSDLTAWSLNGITEIVEVAKRTRESKIRSEAEGGIGVNFLIKLKEGIKTHIESGDSLSSFVKSSRLDDVLKVALAEVVLERENLIEDAEDGNGTKMAFGRHI